MVIEASLVAFLVINRLKAKVLEEPNEPVHNPSDLSQLFGAAPGALAETPLHVLAHLQVLVHLNEQIARLAQFLNQMALLFVFAVGYRDFFQVSDALSIILVRSTYASARILQRLTHQLCIKLHVILQYLADTLDQSDHFHRQAHVQILVMPVRDKLGIEWKYGKFHSFDQN